MVALGQGRLLGDEANTNPDSWALLSDTHLLSESSVERHYAGNMAAMNKRVTAVAKNFDRAAGQLAALPQEPAGFLALWQHDQSADSPSIFHDRKSPARVKQ